MVAGETCSSHGQFLLLGDSGWRVYRQTEEKKTKCIEYLSKYLANWSFNQSSYSEWSSCYFDCTLTQTGSTLVSFCEQLSTWLGNNYPDLWEAKLNGEDVQFPITVVVGSCLNEAVRQSGENWIVKPLREMRPYYQDVISTLSDLLRSCRRACVIGFGTAEYWHVPPAFDTHARLCTTLFTERGVPVWDGDSLWKSLAPYRGVSNRADDSYVDW